MALGLICNAADARWDRWEDRSHDPCFTLKDGTPVFEVWFWHTQLLRWFCMTHNPDPCPDNAIRFKPGDPTRLRVQMITLERQHGIYR